MCGTHFFLGSCLFLNLRIHRHGLFIVNFFYLSIFTSLAIRSFKTQNRDAQCASVCLRAVVLLYVCVHPSWHTFCHNDFSFSLLKRHNNLLLFWIKILDYYGVIIREMF